MGRPAGSKNKVTVGISGEGSSGHSYSIAPDSENTLYIENLPEAMERAKVYMKERRDNPSSVQEEDSAIVFKEGEPFRIINDQYVKNDEALVIIQTRKVAVEYLKLQELKSNLKEGIN